MRVMARTLGERSVAPRQALTVDRPSRAEAGLVAGPPGIEAAQVGTRLDHHARGPDAEEWVRQQLSLGVDRSP